MKSSSSGLHYLVLLLVPGLGLLLTACQLLPKPAAPTVLAPTSLPTPQPLPTSTPMLQPAPIILEKQIQENGDKPAYTLKLAYPYLQGEPAERFLLFNTQVSQIIQQVSAGFKKDFAGLPPSPDPNSYGSYANTTYTVTHGSQGLVSILFRVDYYTSGAAHPNAYFISLNIDLAHQKSLSLADLMKPGVDYLKVLSDYCIADLKKRGILDTETGAGPQEENFKSWNITPTGLQISFDPYQVAAYALGPQMVEIPYSVLNPILNLQGPLSPILQ